MILPQPPIPPDCDITGLPYMQWHVHRFLTSDLVARCSPVEGWAAVLLWNRAWERTPPGSLPDDDAQLARLVAYAMPVWRKARSVAMRHWTLCSDGLLYHPVVAEQVLEAWLARLAKRRKSAAGNASKYHKPFDPAEVDYQIADAEWRLAHARGESPGPIPVRSHSDPTGSPTGIAQGLPVRSQVEVEGKKTTQDGDDPLGQASSTSVARVVVPFRRGGE